MRTDEERLASAERLLRGKPVEDADPLVSAFGGIMVRRSVRDAAFETTNPNAPRAPRPPPRTWLNADSGRDVRRAIPVNEDRFFNDPDGLTKAIEERTKIFDLGIKDQGGETMTTGVLKVYMHALASFIAKRTLELHDELRDGLLFLAKSTANDAGKGKGKGKDDPTALQTINNQLYDLAWVSNRVLERIAALEQGQTMRFTGPHDPAKQYAGGDVVQRSGSTWVALVETQEKPGSSDHWRRIGTDR
ncbi:MAG: hypothetical protein ABI699_09335 [Caldimonas sp.]